MLGASRVVFEWNFGTLGGERENVRFVLGSGAKVMRTYLSKQKRCGFRMEQNATAQHFEISFESCHAKKVI